MRPALAVPRPSEPEIIEEIEAEEALASSTEASAAPIEPVEEDYADDGPTVLRPSPLLAAPIGARPQIAATDSRPVPALSPPPSQHAAPPPSAAKLPPVPKPPSSLSNLLPPSAPSASSTPAELPLEESPVITSKLAASLVACAAPTSSRYVPPSVPPPSPRPLSAEETIPISRYNSLSPHALAELETPPEPPMNRRNRGLFLAAAAGILLLAGLGVGAVKAAPALGFGTQTGSLVITAAGPSGAAPNGLRVFADGVVRCEQSPCTIPDLSTGTHFVSVDAPGFTPTAARAVSVEKSAEATLNVELTPKESPQTAPPPKAEPATTTVSELRPEAQPEPTTQSAKPEASHASAPTHNALARSSKSASSKSAKSAKSTESAKAAGDATLNINSIPMSSVVLDGRPIGSTPLVGVHVSPGSHSVVFINPEKGRKASGATVKAGGTATVAVRF